MADDTILTPGWLERAFRRHKALCSSHEALRERLENAEQAVAEVTPAGFVEAMQTAIEDRERAEAESDRAVAAHAAALWLLDELQWRGPDGSCPCCGARPALHDDTCRLVQMTGWPASAAALARLRRLEAVAEAARAVVQRVTFYGPEMPRVTALVEAVAALDQGEAQP